MHLMITLEDEDKIKHKTEIDKFIYAFIPDKTEEPELYDIVAKYMMHRACGISNLNCICMKNNKCTKRFPKKYIAATKLNDDGYSEYK